MYVLEYKATVAKELRQLPKTQLKRVLKRIQQLAKNPRSVGCVKLQGTDNIYSVRQGDYRIIYTINDGSVTVLVIKIGHRKDVYER